MSTPSFGQSPAFGAAPPAVQAAPVEEPPAGRSNRTVVIAVAAGVVALGVLGGAAALVLGTGEPDAGVALPPGPVSTVEPSVAPSTPPAPLPTAGVQGRNVFVPLVDPAGGDAGADGGVGAAPAAAPAAPAAPATSPTTAPTTAPTAAPVPAPAPLPVTRIVEVPGPTVTETVPGPTVTEPGPTVTTPGPTETLDPFRDYVSVTAVDPDPDADPSTPESSADFVVNGVPITVLEGEYFDEFFQYLGYQEATPPETGPTVRFVYGSSLYSIPVGREIGLGS